MAFISYSCLNISTYFQQREVQNFWKNSTWRRKGLCVRWFLCRGIFLPHHIFGIVILFYFCLLCQVRVSDVSQGDWGQSQGQDQRRHRQTRLGAWFSGLKVTMKRILRNKYNFSFQLERPDTGQYHTNMRVTGFEPDVFRNEMRDGEKSTDLSRGKPH